MGLGKFIALEGIDGSGKSTQAVYLTELIKKTGHQVYSTAEPSTGPVGVMIRQILSGRMKMDSAATAALFAADRLDHISNPVDGLRQKLEAGTFVISDRYYFSSYAYHSLDLPMDWVAALNERAAAALRADITIFIDLSPESAMERISRNRGKTELFEKRETLQKVRGLYLEAFERFKGLENIIIVDGERSPEEIAASIKDIVLEAGIIA